MNLPICITKTFSLPVKRVWCAITKLEQMQQWYFENLPAFTPRVGFETEFKVKTPERIFPHHWKVTEVVPEQKISYEWTFKGYTGRSVTHWKLSEENNVTTLQLIAEVIEPHPDDIPEFKRESGVAGWNYFINERLTQYLTSVD